MITGGRWGNVGGDFELASGKLKSYNFSLPSRTLNENEAPQFAMKATAD